MVLHPEHILAIRPRLAEWEFLTCFQDWTSSGIFPFVNLGMAVGEGKATGEIMVDAWHILAESVLSLIRRTAGCFGKTGHVGHVISPIDKILTHIKEHPDFRRTWAGQRAAYLAKFSVNAIGVRPGSTAIAAIKAPYI